MTIRNMESFIESHWDWSILNGCFPGTKIEPTDVDGIVEYAGRFLFLETKRPGVPIPRGQQIMFDTLRRTGVFTIVVIWGENNTPQRIHVIRAKDSRLFDPANLTVLRAVAAQWFMDAYRHRHQSRHHNQTHT